MKLGESLYLPVYSNLILSSFRLQFSPVSDKVIQEQSFLTRFMLPQPPTTQSTNSRLKHVFIKWFIPKRSKSAGGGYYVFEGVNIGTIKLVYSHSQYSVVRNFVCSGHVEQKHCKATGPPEKRHPKSSASSEAVASACWGASSLGCRSMGQANLQVILAAERRQKRHPERHPNLPQQGPCPFCVLATIAKCRETIGRRRASGLQDSSRNSFQNPCLQAQTKLSQGPCRKVIPIVAVEAQQHKARPQNFHNHSLGTKPM